MQSLLSFDLKQLLAKYTGQSFSMVPNRVLEAVFAQRICSMAAVLYLWMCSMADDEGKMWASVAFIASKFQVQPRTVSRWCAELSCEDLIVRKRRLGRSTITTVLGHPKMVNKLVRSAKPEPHPPEKKITEKSGKPPKTVVPDPECHDVHDPQDHVDSDPFESDPLFETSTKNQDLDPENENSVCKRQENDDDDEELDLGRLWEIAKEAGLPQFFAFGPAFRKHPESLALILELSDDAILWAFRQIEHGPAQLYPRTAAYWVRRLSEQAALYRPSVPPSSPPVEQFEDVPEPESEPTVDAEPPWDGDVEGWDSVRDGIQEMVPETTFRRWFDPIVPGYDGDKLCLWVRDEFDKVFMEKNFTDLLRIWCIQTGLIREGETIRIVCSDDVFKAPDPELEEFRVGELAHGDRVAVTLETLFKAGIRRDDPEYMRKFGQVSGDSDFERAVNMELDGGLDHLKDLIDRGVVETVPCTDEQEH